MARLIVLLLVALAGCTDSPTGPTECPDPPAGVDVVCPVVIMR